MKYKCVNCSFYDELEAFAVLKQRVKIIYKCGGETLEVSSIIKTFETKNGEEFLITQDDLRIRLDFLLEVGGKMNPT